jgi:hypothetical protein
VVQLSATAKCVNNGCKNTIALLGLQDSRLNSQSVVDQSVFNTAIYQSDLTAALDRSANNLSDLQRNNPSKLPPAHKLTMVGGPTNLGLGACGPHLYLPGRPHRRHAAEHDGGAEPRQ